MVAAAVLMVGVLGHAHDARYRDQADEDRRGPAGRRGAGARRRSRPRARSRYRDVEDATIVARLQENESLRATGLRPIGRSGAATSPSRCAPRSARSTIPRTAAGRMPAAASAPVAGAAGHGRRESDGLQDGHGHRDMVGGQRDEDGRRSRAVSSGGRDRPGMASLSLTSPSSDTITSPAVTTGDVLGHHDDDRGCGHVVGRRRRAGLRRRRRPATGTSGGTCRSSTGRTRSRRRPSTPRGCPARRAR